MTPFTSDAACRGHDPAMWYPTDGDNAIEAKAICARCPVRDACLQYAITHAIRDGIWGGLSEKRRRRIPQRSIVCETCHEPFVIERQSSPPKTCSPECAAQRHAAQQRSYRKKSNA